MQRATPLTSLWPLALADSTTPFRIIVGLGNPGTQYSDTRHNVGFKVIDHCAQLLNMAFSRDRTLCSKIAVGELEGQRLLLLKPLTYMNRSGRALLPLQKARSLEPSQILVVCDDIALPFGSLRLRLSGGSGGHNGLKSLQSALATSSFPRLRIGIGQPPEGVNLDEFVLAPFCPGEKDSLFSTVKRAAFAALSWARGGEEQLMAEVNGTRF